MENLFQSFTTSVLKIYKLIQKIKLHEMRGYGLKGIHVMCMYYLRERPEGLTASELMRLTLDDKAAISRALKLLSDKGYIEYDEKTYNSRIRLTPAGFEVAEDVSVKADKAVSAVAEDFTDEQREFFHGTLARIVEHLESYYGELHK